MKDTKSRFVFYAANDLAIWERRERAEEILNTFKVDREYRINDIIEFYQIKLQLDAKLFPSKWTDETKQKYQAIIKRVWPIIVQFFLKLNDDNIYDYYVEVEWSYCNAFWGLVSNLKIYKNINPKSFIQIIENDEFHLAEVLVEENIVNQFSNEIKEILITRPKSAEILLAAFEENKNYDTNKLYFPKTLKLEDKEIIINNYLDLEKPNLNYIRLIVKAKEIKLSDRTKLKAKKLSEKLNNELFVDGTTATHSFQVTIDGKQDEPSRHKYDSESNSLVYSYGGQWMLGDALNIFSVFVILFRYINEQACIELVGKKIEIDSFEDSLMRSQSEYFEYSNFQQKDSLSQAQLIVYISFLKDKNIKLEEVLYFIVNQHLNEKYSVDGFKISFPSDGTSPLEKIRTLAPELEFLIKQYKIYVEEDSIDFELLQISSSPLNVSQVASKVQNKYAYGTGEEFQRYKYYFFSSDPMLHYVEPYKSRYRNLTQLLIKENVQYENFENFQRNGIDYLLSNNYIFINNSGYIKIVNMPMSLVIGILNKEEVINFWHYPEFLQQEILRLESLGLVKFENTLFTLEERKYFNYHLNKKEFTNSLDLRNKYLHGTNTHSIDEQQADYYILLKLLILVILKIEDDLNLYNTINK